jgi:Flp pilus assembly protein TadG
MLSRVPGARRGAGQDGDRGSIAVFTAVFAFAVLLLVALLVDGGSALNARERAADIAEQAARAAATDLSTAGLRSAAGTVTIDWADDLNNGGPCAVAQRAIDAYAKDFNSVTSAQLTSCAEGADPRTATVTVQVTAQPVISALGFSTITMTATQSATAACGNADQLEAC